MGASSSFGGRLGKVILAAGLMHGGLAASLEQNCRLCRPKPDETDQDRTERLERRSRWGCDAEVEHAILVVDCWVCGDGDPDDGCSVCAGSGTHEIRRCPWSIVDGTAIAVVEGLSFFDVGALPQPGGWSEQSATWWDATVLALGERDEYRRRARRKAEQDAARRRGG